MLNARQLRSPNPVRANEINPDLATDNGLKFFQTQVEIVDALTMTMRLFNHVIRSNHGVTNLRPPKSRTTDATGHWVTLAIELVFTLLELGTSLLI